MADPFTLATGIAGLVGLAIQITQITVGFSQAVADAPESAQSFAVEAQALKEVLDKVETFLKNDLSQRSDFLFRDDSVLITTRVQCEQRLKKLLSKLKPAYEGSLARKTWERLVWFFKEKDRRDDIDALHRFAQTFQFCLTIHGWYELFAAFHMMKC
jgi:hypothetical protein